MEPSNNELHSPGAANMTDRNAQDHNDSGVNPQDKLLLEALQQFIMPHIGAAAGQTGSNQNLQGPEAMKLITALKEFISSVVRGSESKAETMIEVSLEEEVQESESAQGVDNADDGHELEASTLPDIFGISRDVFLDNAFHDNVLRRLREHVFNRMPIRLLHFAPQGSHLRISLADKEDIYAHLVSVMEEHKSDPDYQPKRRDRLETDDEASTRLIRKHIGYAILSHTWLHASPGEVTYTNWTNGTFNRHGAGYQKLVNFSTVAWKNHGLTLGWMDTVCINKDSSSELDESIRSMYNWYQGAKVCIIHLADTQRMSDVYLDTWFTRGWTLQELFAPTHIKFYNQDWKCLAQDASSSSSDTDFKFGSAKIKAQILKATTITDYELNHMYFIPLSRRMQLAASRKVTREEDTAYSLMGIFDVSISTAYGEGATRAFRRLLYEVLNSKSWGVLDLFNWAGEIFQQTYTQSQLLPSSPENYIYRSSDKSLPYIYPLAPLTITHMGIYIPVVLMPIALSRGQEVQHNPIGDYSAQLTVSMKLMNDYQYSPFTTSTLLFLDTKAFDAVDYLNNIWYQAVVFNIQQDSRGIYIPQSCFAKLLNCYEHPGQVTSLGRKHFCITKEPLVFDMKYSGPNELDSGFGTGFLIPEDELAKHGMQFISLYL